MGGWGLDGLFSLPNTDRDNRSFEGVEGASLSVARNLRARRSKQRSLWASKGNASARRENIEGTSTRQTAMSRVSTNLPAA